MFDMVARSLKFSLSNFLILLHTNTFEQCYYTKNPTNDLKILQNLHLKKNNKILQSKNDLFPTKL